MLSMRFFLGKIVIIVLTVFVLLSLFDLTYTYIYTKSIPRNKTKYVLDLKDKQVDYVFLGSSRVENHIDTKLVKQLTSKTALNLGIQGAKLDDNYMLLQLLINNKVKIGTLFLQVDYIFNKETPSVIVSSEALPYIKTNEIVRKHVQLSDSNYLSYYHIPFYRFMLNDYKIGFREFFSATIGKKSKTDFEDGFVPKDIKFIKEGAFELPNTIIEKNKIFDLIDMTCKKNNINVVYFCAPFCSYVSESKYIDKLKTKIPRLKDYSKALNDEYFYNCGHLNATGAKEFTKMLVKDCMTNEK